MKKTLKRVSLNTETLRALDSPRLEGVAAGASVAQTICYPCTETHVCSRCAPCY